MSRFPSIGYGATVLLVGERAPKNDWDVLYRSTDRPGALPLRGLHAAGPGLVLQADLNLAVWTSQPWSNKLLTWVVASAARLVVAGSSRCSSNGSGRLEARPAQGREQLVGEVRLISHVEQDLHYLTNRRDVPEPGADTRPGGRPGQDGLEFFLLCAGGFRRVPVPRMAGQHRAHPGGLPLGRPLLHRPFGPLDHLRDDAHVDATGGVQDRLGLHPHQHMIVGTPPPPDQDGGLLRGDPDPHAPTASETAQETHEKHGSVSCQP